METLYYRKIAELAHRDGGEAMRAIARRVLAVGHDTDDRICRPDKRALKTWMRQWCAAIQQPRKREAP